MIRKEQGGWALVVLAAMLMLLAFQSVVRRSVDQGAARRAEVARQTDAVAECNRLPGRERRSRCRAGNG